MACYKCEDECKHPTDCPLHNEHYQEAMRNVDRMDINSILNSPMPSIEEVRQKAIDRVHNPSLEQSFAYSARVSVLKGLPHRDLIEAADMLCAAVAKMMMFNDKTLGMHLVSKTDAVRSMHRSMTYDDLLHTALTLHDTYIHEYKQAQLNLLEK